MDHTLSYIPEESLGFMAGTTIRLMNALLRKKMRETGIDLSTDQWCILILLWDRREMTQQELLSFSCMDKSALSRLLTQLEERGLVERRPDPNNGSHRHILATDKALALRRLGVPAARQALQQVLAGVSEEDLAACLRVLATVKRTLQTPPKA